MIKIKNYKIMNIIEAMKERCSVRSYDGNGINAAQRDELLTCVQEVSSPFGGEVEIRLKEFELKGEYKPSTYGVIRGARDFFLLGIGSYEASALSAGFKFEQVVLKAWEMGLGTCWIAGTFKGEAFDRGEVWNDGEELKVICPVGVGTKRSLLEKVGRLAMRSDSRRPFDSLFFYQNADTPIPADNRFREALEMMRLAPSSTNSQPWRAIATDDAVHFFYVKKSPISVLDCGIGLSHFYLTEKFNNREGRFSDFPATENTPDCGSLPKDWHYLLSYYPGK